MYDEDSFISQQSAPLFLYFSTNRFEIDVNLSEYKKNIEESKI